MTTARKADITVAVIGARTGIFIAGWIVKILLDAVLKGMGL